MHRKTAETLSLVYRKWSRFVGGGNNVKETKPDISPLFVRNASGGMSSRFAAVKAPEVMTRRSSVIVFMVAFVSWVVLWRRSLRLPVSQPFISKACEQSSCIILVRQQSRSVNDESLNYAVGTVGGKIV